MLGSKHTMVPFFAGKDANAFSRSFTQPKHKTRLQKRQIKVNFNLNFYWK